MVVLATLTEKINFIQSVFGPGRLARNAKNIDVRCPICAPRDPSKRKLAIRVDDDRNHCWTCGWRAHTLAPLIRKYSSRDRLLEYAERFMPATERQRRCIMITADEMPQSLELPKDFRLLALASRSDPDTKALRRYAEARGLSDHDLWYYRIGISDDVRWRRRLIVPSFDREGELNYYVGRAIDERRRPKYDNPDIDKLPIIFNELNVDWARRLVLCEGAFDMFKCGDNVVPLLGSDLNEQSAIFNALLVHNTPIALALDADMWETKTPRTAKKLAEYDIDVVVIDTRPFGDPGLATRQQFQDALARARPVDWHDAFSLRLDRASRTSLAF